jgi:membrane-bound metal-dependent hydrolase YbcI (DUF457 family)
MPQYRTHLVGGVISCVILYSILSYARLLYAPVWQLFVCALFGSLFPDVDTKSVIQRICFYIVIGLLILFIAMQRMYAAATLSVMACVPLIVRHRGLFHRLSFVAILSGSVVLVVAAHEPRLTSALLCNMAFFLVGVLSHLMLDFGITNYKRYW